MYQLSALPSSRWPRWPGATPPLPNPIRFSIMGSANWTPLHEAALNDRKAVAESLLASNAEVNAKEELGATPLHVAAWRGSTDMV